MYSALLPHGTTLTELQRRGVAGVILSGGPASVYSEGAPAADPGLFQGSIPVLGICYGYQLMVKAHGGEVGRAEKKEYGRASIQVAQEGGLFDGLRGERLVCWLSPSDSAKSVPATMEVLASSAKSP